MDNVKKIGVLGCTGSVGMQTLDVIKKLPERLEVYSLTAHSRYKEAVELAN